MEPKKSSQCEFCGDAPNGRMAYPAYDTGMRTTVIRNHWLCAPCGEQIKYARDQVQAIGEKERPS